MSQPVSLSNTSLSLPARLLFYLGPPITILLTAVTCSPKTAFLSPLAFVPTALCYYQWRRSNKSNPIPRGELEVMVWTYWGVGTLGLATCALTQLGVCWGLSGLLLSSQKQSDFLTEIQRTSVEGLSLGTVELRRSLSRSWQVWLINGVFSFLSAGFVEEALKYAPIAYVRWRRGYDHGQNHNKAQNSGDPNQETEGEKETATTITTKPGNKAYLDYAIAAALGFGLIEAIGNISITSSSPSTSSSSSSSILYTLFERTLFGAFGHAILAALTGLRAIRSDPLLSPAPKSRSWIWTILPSTILHGLNDFSALSCSNLEGNVGWIHPTTKRNQVGLYTVIVGLLTTATWLVHREWREVQQKEREKEEAEK